MSMLSLGLGLNSCRPLLIDSTTLNNYKTIKLVYTDLDLDVDYFIITLRMGLLSHDGPGTIMNGVSSLLSTC